MASLGIAGFRGAELCLAAGLAGLLQAADPAAAVDASAAGRVLVVAQLHPDANDANPGTAERLFKTIARAAKEVQPGDMVLIEDGLYRESVKITTSGTAAQPISFQAAPMASVTVTGAERITDWQREEGEANIFSTQWPYEYTGWSKRRTQPDDDYHIMIGRAEQVHCEVRNCLILNNENAGIFYEISYGLRARDNVIIGNGQAPRFGAWGANGGIAISSSPHCVIERNLLIANKEGLQFREQGRTTNRIGEDGKTQYAVWNHDQVIRNNLIAHNRDAQTWGWFATGDGRLWPRSLFEEKTGKPAPEPLALPAGTDLDRLDKTPVGMTLEDLRLNLTGNLYAAKPGQRLYVWGCGWDPHEVYADLPAVHRALALESGSQLVQVQFADWTTLDLRVPADSPVLKAGCYPQGEVPGARLGTLGEQ
jgi:hypothetical protein